MSDTIEFYEGRRLVCRVESSMSIAIGTRISIREETWLVRQVTFALDHADEIQERHMRCNVDLEKEAAMTTPRIEVGEWQHLRVCPCCKGVVQTISGWFVRHLWCGSYCVGSNEQAAGYELEVRHPATEGR